MNDFTWVDLSTFDLAKARAFYERVLGWSYLDAGGGYSVSMAGWVEAAGLYPMPEFFRKIKMPSFWMSYIEVADIDATVAKAEALGAEIELREDNAFGRIALIRDPLGAGFTVNQNEAMKSSRGDDHGMWCWSELVISDLSKAETFYSNLFGWSFTAGNQDQHMIHHADGQAVGSVQVAANEIKGDKEYWAVCFTVQDLAQAAQTIEQAGGQVVDQYETSDGQVLIARDDQGATFYLTAG
ncbi:MAG: VOC family protein [Planctomycetota bacterium]